MSADVQPAEDNNFPEKQRTYLVGKGKPPKQYSYQPGQSGNPGGVKRGQVFVSECYKRLLLLDSKALADYQPQNAAEAIALRQISTAIFGAEALPSAKEIVDRTEGKAPQKIEVSTVNVENKAAAFMELVTLLADKHGLEPGIVRDRLLQERPELAEWIEG